MALSVEFFIIIFMHILIIANGPLHNPLGYQKIITSSDFIIACDGGYFHASKLGIKNVDSALGDFDSLSPENCKAKELISFPHDKDKTDFELALEYAASKSPQKISVISATGDRQDHTLNNILACARYKELDISLFDEYNEIFVIQKNKNIIRGNVGQKISFIPLELPIKNVSSQSLRYALDTSWFNTGKLSISNEFSKEEAVVTLDNARFIVIKVLQNR